MIKPRTTLGMAMFLLGLLTFVFWDMATSDQRRETETVSRRLVTVEDSHAEWIEFAANPARARPRVRLECRESGGCALGSDAKWEITAPEQTDADAALIGAFLATLNQAEYRERIALDENRRATDWRADFGLKNPLVVATIKFKSAAAPLKLEFGEAAMVGNDHYVVSSREPDTVLALPGYFVRAIDRDFFHWRNKRLFPGAVPAQVATARWTHAQIATPFRFEREGDDWRMRAPFNARAEFLAVEGIVSGLVTWNARALAPSGTKPGAKPTLIAEFAWGEGSARRTEKLEVFPAADKTKFLARSSARNWIAEVDASEVARFVRAAPEYRDTQLLSRTDAKRAVAAEIETKANEKWAFVKRDGRWEPQAAPSEARAAERTALVGKFLALFTEPEVKAHVARVGPEAQKWQKESRLAVRFRDDKKELVQEFHIASNLKDTAYAEGEKATELRRLSPRFALAAALDPKLAPKDNSGEGGGHSLGSGGAHVH